MTTLLYTLGGIAAIWAIGAFCLWSYLTFAEVKWTRFIKVALLWPLTLLAMLFGNVQ